MRSDDGRTAAAEGVVDEFAGPAAVSDHAGDQLDRLGGRMELACHRPGDFEDRVVGAVIDEIVRTVSQPAIQDGLMPVVIVASPKNECLLYPDQTMAIAKAAILETLDEVFQEETWHSRVDDGPGHGVLPSDLEGGGEQFLELCGLERIILD